MLGRCRRIEPRQRRRLIAAAPPARHQVRGQPPGRLGQRRHVLLFGPVERRREILAALRLALEPLKSGVGVERHRNVMALAMDEVDMQRRDQHLQPGQSIARRPLPQRGIEHLAQHLAQLVADPGGE